MTYTESESTVHTEINSSGNTPQATDSCTTRRISCNGLYKTISFEAIVQGLTVRITDDGHMLALDFLSTLTNGDRKKASQTLARINSRSDISGLLTLRWIDGKHKSRKLVSFSNAVQLLLVLPKRTVLMETRRAVAGVLTDFYEYRHQQKESKKPTVADQSMQSVPDRSKEGEAVNPFSSVAINPLFQFSPYFTDERRRLEQRQAQVDLTHREMELERQRSRIPLDRLNQCMELMERCGPMSEEEQRKFKALISEQIMSVNSSQCKV